jgi:SNF2 family DNA or RNA helicase
MTALRELLAACQIGNRTSPQGTAEGGASQKSDSNDYVALPASNLFSPHRALIFCQWKAVIDLISEYIDRGLFGAEISYLRLDGSTPVANRQHIADTFNEDKSIDLLLLTTHV